MKNAGGTCLAASLATRVASDAAKCISVAAF
jgi:hypothetical protein